MESFVFKMFENTAKTVQSVTVEFNAKNPSEYRASGYQHSKNATTYFFPSQFIKEEYYSILYDYSLKKTCNDWIDLSSNEEKNRLKGVDDKLFYFHEWTKQFFCAPIEPKYHVIHEDIYEDQKKILFQKYILAWANKHNVHQDICKETFESTKVSLYKQKCNKTVTMIKDLQEMFQVYNEELSLVPQIEDKNQNEMNKINNQKLQSEYEKQRLQFEILKEVIKIKFTKWYLK